MINFFSFNNFFKIIRKITLQELSGPFLIIIILSMMIIPLNSFFLDLLFTFNIFISILVLLVSMMTKSILEFTSFPTVLLFTTLLRLSLNIASTRVILLFGHLGEFSAGHVIESFGHFLVGSNFSIGIIVFLILVIINFVVITKGASRIAEVSARFILDGMPGKQMSIDSDLNAGLIKESEAKIRRSYISQEADFYGSMDGASKFVRGDAIAGILIMIINIIGGLVIGLLQHHMNVFQAVKVYTLLTIGDGLVAQIPALIISTAVAVIVTRVDNTKNVSEQMITQLFSNLNIIFLSGFILMIFGLIPGMPHTIFLLFSMFLLLFKLLYKKTSITLIDKTKKNKFKKNKFDLSLNDLSLEDFISISLGNDLLDLINYKNKKNLFDKIFSVRKKYLHEFGFLSPKVNIIHDSNLLSSQYKIFIRGIESASGFVYLKKYLAISSHFSRGELSGKKTTDPIFGLKSYWIKNKYKKLAKNKKYQVMDSLTVISKHFDSLLSINMSDLFSRQDMQNLLNKINVEVPELTENLIPNTFTLTKIKQVFQNLLLEHIPIKDMRTILEVLIENSSYQKNIDELINIVRISLGKSIVQRIFLNKMQIHAIGISVHLEKIFVKSLYKNKIIDSAILTKFVKEAKKSIILLESMKYPVVFIVNHTLRFFIFRLLKTNLFHVNVLSNLEIPNNKKVIFIQLIK
ncbi:MAG: flagellar type III secretion system protein FlhA [Buchnera aphidicola (Periphyllus aceris)]|nr:flagellar type III secretion system protein FlhA [Buchnera aphidicola (Periphyllus aceris)]